MIYVQLIHVYLAMISRRYCKMSAVLRKYDAKNANRLRQFFYATFLHKKEFIKNNKNVGFEKFN